MKTFMGNTMKAIMKERGMSASDLSKITGIGKPSISGYVNNKVIPSTERVVAIAQALSCTVDDLFSERETTPVVTTVSVLGSNKLTIKKVAALMHKHEGFVRRGLQQGILPFGSAVKGRGGKYSYYISPVKFTEFTGIKV